MTCAKRFELVFDSTGRKRWVRTEEERARRRALEQAAKSFRSKLCKWCGREYTPKFQHGTKRWEQSSFCCRVCLQAHANRRPEYRARKNAKRRGDTALHRKEYLRRIELLGGTRWHLEGESFRDAARLRNRVRYSRLYGKDIAYTMERRANASYQGARRKYASAKQYLTPQQVRECKEIRAMAKRCGSETGLVIHVDHLLPLRRGGWEHPDNLLPMRAEANLFWGDRIKRCPWPKPLVWDEPNWEPCCTLKAVTSRRSQQATRLPAARQACYCW